MAAQLLRLGLTYIVSLTCSQLFFCLRTQVQITADHRGSFDIIGIVGAHFLYPSETSNLACKAAGTITGSCSTSNNEIP